VAGARPRPRRPVPGQQAGARAGTLRGRRRHAHGAGAGVPPRRAGGPCGGARGGSDRRPAAPAS
jgi:hypothetical protein